MIQYIISINKYNEAKYIYDPSYLVKSIAFARKFDTPFDAKNYIRKNKLRDLNPLIVEINVKIPEEAAEKSERNDSVWFK